MRLFRKIISLVLCFTIIIPLILGIMPLKVSALDNQSPFRFSGPYISDKWLTGVTESSSFPSGLDTAEIVVKEDSRYKVVRRFISWWEPTCQHVGHDEWKQVVIDKATGTERVEGEMIVYQQNPAGSYNPNLHSWAPNVPSSWTFVGKVTLPEGEANKYERPCTRKAGYWGDLEPCSARDPNYGPIVKINAPAQAYVGQAFTVSSNSIDTDGYITTYEWITPGAANSISGQSGTLTYNTPGTYTITLKCTDNEYGEGQASVNVTVVNNIYPVLSVTSKNITPTSTIFPNESAVTDVLEDISFSVQLNNCTNADNIDKWELTVTKDDGGPAQTITYSGTAAQSLSRDAIFSGYSALSISKDKILAEKFVTQGYKISARATFKSPVAGFMSVELPAPESISATASISETPQFSIWYNNQDVTDKGIQVPGTPYTVTLKDSSSGSIVSRDWYYTDAAGNTSVISTGNETSVTFDVPSLDNATFKLRLNGNDNLKVSHSVNAALTPPPPPPAPPVDTNKAPTAGIAAPGQVLAGTPFNVYVSGQDSDGTVKTLALTVPGVQSYTYNLPAPSSSTGYIFTAKCPNVGTYDTTGIAIDDKGAAGSARASIKVVEPVPTAAITTSGLLKTNRRVTLSSSTSIPTAGDYPVDFSKNQWVVEPLFTVEAGKTLQDYIKFSGLAGASFSGNKLYITGNENIPLLFKKEGSYKVTLTVSNYYTPEGQWLSNTTSTTIAIQKDVPPVAGIDTADMQYRNPANGNKAAFSLDNTAYSPDGDRLGYIKLSYIYNANNDGIFGDAGESEVVLKELSDITQILQFNNCSMLVNDVGRYKIIYHVIEAIPDSDTIPGLLAPSDYLSDTYERVVEVKNLAPTTSLQVMKKRNVEAEFIYDASSGLSPSDVQNLINTEVLPALSANNIAFTSNIKSASGFSDPVITKPNPVPVQGYLKQNAAVAPPYDILLDNNHVPGVTSLKIVDTRNNTYRYVTGNFYIPNAFGSYKVLTFNSSHFYIYVIDKDTQKIYCVDCATGNVVWSRLFRPDTNTQIYLYHEKSIMDLSSWYDNLYSISYIGYIPRHDFCDKDCFVQLKNNKDSTGNIISHTFTKIDPFTGQDIYSITPYDISTIDWISDINRRYDFSDDVKISATEAYTTGATGQPGTFTINIYNLRDGSLRASRSFTYQDYWVTLPGYADQKRLIQWVSLDAAGNITYLVQTNFSHTGYSATYWGYGTLYQLIKLDINGNILKTVDLPPIRDRSAYGDTGWYTVSTTYAWYQYIGYSVKYNGVNHVVLEPVHLTECYYVNIPSGYVSSLFTIPYVDITYREFDDDLYIVSYEYTDLGMYTNEYGETYQYYEHYIDIKQCSASGVMTVNSGWYEEKTGLYSNGSPFPPKPWELLDNDRGITPMYISTFGDDFDYGVLRVYSREEGMMVKDQWQDNTEHYVVFISKKDTNPGVVTLRNLQIMLEKSVSLVEMVKPSVQAEAQQHIALLDDNGKYIDNTDYNQAFRDFRDYVIGEKAPPYTQVKFGVVGDEFNATGYYSDAENDPKYTDGWKFVHDPSKVNGVTIDNPMPVVPESGITLSAPLSKFTSAGTYTITYSAQDNPKADPNFSSYRQWSDPGTSTIIYNIHRKPVAQFKISLTPSGSSYIVDVTDNNLSYDPDHSSRPDRGIVAREWKWKEESETEWHIGRMSGTFPADKKYMVYLRVQDTDNGTWSDPLIETLTANQNDTTAPALAISPTAADWTNQDVTVTLTADDTGGSGYRETRYVISNSASPPSESGLTSTTGEKSTNIILKDTGIWYIHAQAYDNQGNKSGIKTGGPYKLAYPAVDIFFTIISIDYESNGQVAAGEAVRLVDSADFSKGVRIVSNVEIASANVYLNGNYSGMLTLGMPFASGGSYIYNAGVFDLGIPADMPDGTYAITVEALTAKGTGKSENVSIVVFTPVNLKIELKNTEESRIYTPLTSTITEGGTFNSVITRDYPNIFKASATEYVSNIELIFYDEAGSPVLKTYLSHDFDKKLWFLETDMTQEAFQVVSHGTAEIFAWTPNGNVESQKITYYLRKPGIYDLRISDITDPQWKNYFVQPDGQPSWLQETGIKMEDMPVYRNKEYKGIKLGYKISFEFDTVSLNKYADYIEINASFYALDKTSTLYKADIYIPDENGEYKMLESSAYNNLSGHIYLDKSSRSTSEDYPGIVSCNTWRFDYFIPPVAKVVKKGEMLDLINNNTFDYKLLVVLYIHAYSSNGKRYDLNDAKQRWGSGDGSTYGKNRPTRLSLLGLTPNYGEIMWYNLYDTALDDLYTERRW